MSANVWRPEKTIDVGPATYQELRDWIGDESSVLVEGRAAPGDGGAGMFTFYSTGVAGTFTDDNGIIIVPTGGDGSSAWVRENVNPVDIAWYCDPSETVDCSVYFQRAHDFLYSTFGRGEVKFSGTYLIRNALVWLPYIVLSGEAAGISVLIQDDLSYGNVITVRANNGASASKSSMRAVLRDFTIDGNNSQFVTQNSTIVAASDQITVEDSSVLAVNMLVEGNGIPDDTYITSIDDATHVTMSSVATASITDKNVGFRTAVRITATSVLDSNSISVTSTTGIHVGMLVSGAAYGNHTYVTAIVGSVVTLNRPAELSATGIAVFSVYNNGIYLEDATLSDDYVEGKYYRGAHIASVDIYQMSGDGICVRPKRIQTHIDACSTTFCRGNGIYINSCNDSNIKYTGSGSNWRNCYHVISSATPRLISCEAWQTFINDRYYEVNCQGNKQFLYLMGEIQGTARVYRNDPAFKHSIRFSGINFKFTSRNVRYTDGLSDGYVINNGANGVFLDNCYFLERETEDATYKPEYIVYSIGAEARTVIMGGNDNVTAYNVALSNELNKIAYIIGSDTAASVQRTKRLQFDRIGTSGRVIDLTYDGVDIGGIDASSTRPIFRGAANGNGVQIGDGVWTSDPFRIGSAYFWIVDDIVYFNPTTKPTHIFDGEPVNRDLLTNITNTSDTDYNLTPEEMERKLIRFNRGVWASGHKVTLRNQIGSWFFINLELYDVTLKTINSSLEKAIFVSESASEVMVPNFEHVRWCDGFSTPGLRFLVSYTDAATYSRLRQFSASSAYTWTGAALAQTSVNLETLIGADWNTRFAPDMKDSSDGTKIWINNETTIFQLSTVDSSVASGTLAYAGLKFNVSAFCGTIRGFDFNADYSKIYITDSAGKIHQCALSGDITTLVYEKTFDVSGKVTSLGAIRFYASDKYFVVTDKSTGSFHSYRMIIPGDIETSEWRIKFADSSKFTAAGKMAFDIPSSADSLLFYSYSVSAAGNRPFTYSINTSAGVVVPAGAIKELVCDGELVFDPNAYLSSYPEVLTNKTLTQPKITSYTWATKPSAVGIGKTLIEISDVGIGKNVLFVSDNNHWIPASGKEVRLAQGGIQIIKAPSGNVGANGAIVFGTALPIIYTISYGCWIYLPAGAAYSGSAAGFYWCVLSSDTTGTLYNNIYIPGTNNWTPPASPTAIVDAGPGAYVGSVAEITYATFTLPGGLLGKYGHMVIQRRVLATLTANSKAMSVRFNGTLMMASSVASLAVYALVLRFINLGSESVQAVNGVREGGSAGSTPFYEEFKSIDTSADVTVTLTMQTDVATDALVASTWYLDAEPYHG